MISNVSLVALNLDREAQALKTNDEIPPINDVRAENWDSNEIWKLIIFLVRGSSKGTGGRRGHASSQRSAPIDP